MTPDLISDGDLTPEKCAARRARMNSRIDRRESWFGVIGVGLVFAVVLLLALGGCAQSNDQASDQVAPQRTAASPVSTQQQEQMAPKRIFVQVVQHPERPEKLNEDGVSEDAKGAAIPGLSDQRECPGDDHRTYAIGAITVNITEGGAQTPSLGGGGATGTATGTQSAAQTPSQYPTQHIQPETSASVPIAVGMPGSSQSQQSTATGPGANGDLNPSQTNSNPANYTSVRVPNDQLAKVLELLGKPGASPSPATQPAAP